MQLSVTKPRPDPAVDGAYAHCWQIATSHYENFTVGSWLLPRRLRQHIAAIYAFARSADDLADEGPLAPAERLARLNAWEEQLEQCYRGERVHPIFIALGHTADRFQLPIEPFRRLLCAFRSDAEFKPFATFDELREYCRCSADPVGQLILYLFGYRDAERQRLADEICTGLQLANFCQDISVDAAKGRLYVPLEDLSRFRCSVDAFMGGTGGAGVHDLMEFEVGRARAMLTRGLELAEHVDRRLAREVRLFGWGGLAILDAIEAVDYDVFRHRPMLSKPTKLGLLFRTFITRPAANRGPFPQESVDRWRDGPSRGPLEEGACSGQTEKVCRNPLDLTPERAASHEPRATPWAAEQARGHGHEPPSLWPRLEGRAA